MKARYCELCRYNRVCFWADFAAELAKTDGSIKKDQCYYENGKTLLRKENGSIKENGISIKE